MKDLFTEKGMRELALVMILFSPLFCAMALASIASAIRTLAAAHHRYATTTERIAISMRIIARELVEMNEPINFGKPSRKKAKPCHHASNVDARDCDRCNEGIPHRD